MASWVVLDGSYPHNERYGYPGSLKRRHSVSDDELDGYHMDWSKRPRLVEWRGPVRHHSDHQDHHDHHDHHYRDQPDAPHDIPSQPHPHHRDGGPVPAFQHGVDAAVRGRQLHQKGFIIIRQHSEPPEPRSMEMERTESGLSVASEPVHTAMTEEEEAAFEARAFKSLLSDDDAAHLVEKHIRGYRSDSQSGRILKSLINPKSKYLDFPLDDEALASIFSAANELFFANRLDNRVSWDWSHQSSSKYSNHIVGTTALRRSACLGGYETLIVLSSPILRDTQFNRRLVISTFLHEMIHSFLFVACGVKARKGGGHTPGFHQIAQTIDDWAGPDTLRLSQMEADLDWFREDNGHHQCNDHHHHHHHHQQYVNTPEFFALPAPPRHDMRSDGRHDDHLRRRPYDTADWRHEPPFQPAPGPQSRYNPGFATGESLRTGQVPIWIRSRDMRHRYDNIR